MAILRKKVAAFTNRSDHIRDQLLAIRTLTKRDNFMIAFVEGGPNEVVHRGVDDCKSLRGRFLDILHRAEEDPCIADEKPARFKEDSHSEWFQDRQDRGGIVFRRDSLGMIS